MAIINNESGLQPKTWISEVVGHAKKDLNPGETVDGIGGFSSYGVAYPLSDADGLVPLGLLEGGEITKPIKEGDPITIDSIELPDNLINDLRKSKTTKEMNLDKNRKLELFRMMLLIRLFEESLEEMFSRGILHGTMHLSIGQEATATGACLALDKEDLITSTHRGHGHCLAKGAEPFRMFAELLGREDGYCRGRGGSMHIADLSNGNLGANGVVAGSLTIAVGAAQSLKMQKKDNIVLCFFGDGAVNEGSFHEALNLASLWELPVLFLCENNQYGMSMASKNAIAGGSIVKRAESYGIESSSIDGNDVEAVYQSVLTNKKEIISNSKPRFIECVTYRYRGHSKSDRNLYRTDDEINFWKEEKDPLIRFTSKLLEENIKKTDLEKIESEVKDEIKSSVKKALQSPESSQTNLEEDSYA